MCMSALFLALSFGAGGSAFAQPKPALKVAMSTWVGYGLLHLAKEKGFFSARGVEVELITVQDKPSTAAALATGRLDGWATTVDTFIFYNAQKIGVKQVVAVDFSAGGEGIISVASIKTVADLKGKTIAAEEGSSTYFFLLNALQDAGLTIRDVKIQNMRAGDAGAAFAAGRVDAAATWDPWLKNASKRKGGHVIADTRTKPGLIVDTVAFRREVIEKRRPDVVNFIRAYFDAFGYWKANPDESNALMAKALGIKLPEFKDSLAGIEFTGQDANRRYFAGEINRVTSAGIKSYREAGLLKDQVDPASIVDSGPLLEALSK